MDTIHISNLSIHLINGLGPSSFNLLPPPPCPALINLSIHTQPHIIPSCVGNDAMGGLGVNYSSVSKSIYALTSDPKRSFGWPEALVTEIAEVPLRLGEEIVESVDVKVELSRAVLMAQSVVYSASFTVGQEEGRDWCCEIKDIRISCIIGLHKHERQAKQRLEVDVKVSGYKEEKWDHRAFTDQVVEYLQSSSSGTLEALADNLAGHLLSTSVELRGEVKLRVTIRKPSALPFATPSITIERTLTDYTSRRAVIVPSESTPHDQTTSRSPRPSGPINGDTLASSAKPSATIAQAPVSSGSAAKRIFIALGSNLGDRVSNIKSAVRSLEEAGCKVKACGKMYESEPMYVEAQDRFINTVIEVETTLAPLELLWLLKHTETAIGRTKTYANGPRVVDLDLLFYGQEMVRLGEPGDEGDEGVDWLECPHPRIAEREFVLRPLADITPVFTHPSLTASISGLLSHIRRNKAPQLAPIIAFPFPAPPLRLDRFPMIMQIFNATPDSFSDGDLSHLSVPLALERIRDVIDSPLPPAILDIGGMSTRPNSVPCSEGEEINRAVPLITAIRSSPDERLRTIPISIDTYRRNVARAAVQAGASCINDVRGGREPGMLEVMAELNVPVILMHSRGDSTSMMTSELQDYSALGGVVAGVRSELGETVKKALQAGVKAWNIILDPGLGFAKSHADSLTLLRHLTDLDMGYPLLVGGSRKGFVGKTIERDKADERGYGDAAVTAWCCQSGVVGIVRVHEGRGMGEVIRMYERISRS